MDLGEGIMRFPRYLFPVLIPFVLASILQAQKEQRQPLTEAQIDKIREAGLKVELLTGKQSAAAPSITPARWRNFFETITGECLHGRRCASPSSRSQNGPFIAPPQGRGRVPIPPT